VRQKKKNKKQKKKNKKEKVTRMRRMSGRRSITVISLSPRGFGMQSSAGPWK